LSKQLCIIASQKSHQVRRNKVNKVVGEKKEWENKNKEPQLIGEPSNLPADHGS